MLSDRGYGLQRPTLQDEDLAELDSIYSTGSMASQYSSQPIYSNGVFFPPSPSLSRSNSHPALQDDGEADEDDGFLLGFGAGLVEAEDAHEAEYTAADSQKILFEFDDHGADRRTALQRQREQQRATAALERSARQYRERVDAVLRGQHLITLEQAVELAGLQIQIDFGEYIRPGAIELCLVLPHRYAGAKGVEAMCFAEHTKVKDKTDAEAREQYIKTCRATRTYGALHTIMYEKIRGKSKRVTRIVGVTRKDFICVEPETHEIAASYALSSIRRWATNDTAAPAASTASPSLSPSSPPSASPKDDAAADGPGSLTIWFGNGTTEGTVVRFETKRQAAASAAEALLITALKSIRKVRPASSASALSAGCSETDYTTDDGFHSPSPATASQQQRHRRRAQRRSSAHCHHTPTSDYATTPDGTPEVQRRSSSGKKHRRSASAARAAASTFTLASPAASGISRRRSQSKASSAAAGASAAPTPFSAPASSAPSSAASSPGSSRRVMASTKGDSIVYNASPTPSPSSADGGASTASLTSKKNRRWSTASIESGGSVDSVGSVRSAGASPSSVAGGASVSPTNRWSWPQAAAGEAAATVPGLPRTSPLRHSVSASDTALNSKAGSVATYAVPRRRASTSVVVEVVPMPMPMPLQPSLDGDRASGGAVYDLLRSEMTRLRSSAASDYI